MALHKYINPMLLLFSQLIIPFLWNSVAFLVHMRWQRQSTNYVATVLAPTYQTIDLHTI